MQIKSFRQFICALIALIALCPLTALSEDPYADLWPKIDGSTATIPLSEALVMRFAGLDAKAATETIHHNMTPQAYANLIAGNCELIFVTQPSAEELAAAKKAGVELVVIPVAKDALVFLNNAQNPVEKLTRDQLRDIYTGKLTNWKDVGGQDAAIHAFQRPELSGSQTLFLQELMGDTKPAAAPSEWIYGYMNTLVDAVSAYDNAEHSLGYSVYYYIHAMYGNERMRMLAVDGVVPSHQTIADDAYPLITYYYAVVRADLPKDAAAHQLIEWLLTDEGQLLAEQAGYVPMHPLEEGQP